MLHKDPEGNNLVSIFGKALKDLYQVIYPGWWGGSGKQSEEEVTCKVNNLPFQVGSTAFKTIFENNRQYKHQLDGSDM